MLVISAALQPKKLHWQKKKQPQNNDYQPRAPSNPGLSDSMQEQSHRITEWRGSEETTWGPPLHPRLELNFSFQVFLRNWKISFFLFHKTYPSALYQAFYTT